VFITADFTYRSELILESDDWSDDEEDEEPASSSSASHKDSKLLAKKVSSLQKKLALSNQALEEYKALIAEKIHPDILGAREEDDSRVVKDPREEREGRDDDSHYFESYGENGGSSFIFNE
jgi:hypothetical protein